MPRHGTVSKVTPAALDIFNDTAPFEATNYHSLHINIAHPCQTTSISDPDKWQKSQSCPDLQPLAWDLTDHQNGAVLLAARHVVKPFWGVQYHPESICTDSEGANVILTWWKAALSWSATSRRQVIRKVVSQPPMRILKASLRHDSIEIADTHFAKIIQDKGLRFSAAPQWQSGNVPSTDVFQLYQKLGRFGDQVVVLRSGKQANGQLFNEELGRYSIIGFVNNESVHLQYQVDGFNMSLWYSKKGVVGSVQSTIGDVFAYLKQLMSHVKFDGGPPDSPFWGGLMGYISYEAGLPTLNIEPKVSMSTASPTPSKRPDINFALVTRSIVIDHATNTLYVQSIEENDTQWVEAMFGVLTAPPVDHARSSAQSLGAHEPSFCSPSWAEYSTKILQCEKAIRKGDSYELCLTNQLRVKVPRINRDSMFLSNFLSGWDLFERLSKSNSATFSAFVRLITPFNEAVTVVSSSPERFLSWNRGGHCQYRPIKGTVKKGPHVSYEDAEKILYSSKEKAENLMITDLIRHDLHGVAGPGNVSVTKLMEIEEYATVYQLVSVIEGDLPTAARSPKKTNEVSNGPNKTQSQSGAPPDVCGIDVLAASLPPGSMTGAPKKRSCQLLADIEKDEPRGIYSGVLGYLDVGGGGDFSVVIRTAYRWDSDLTMGEKGEYDVWNIGAGGAITAQSKSEDEYAEMLTKLNSTLGGFGLHVEPSKDTESNAFAELQELEEELNKTFPGRQDAA
jgi:para-aminobenzoate synthetase